MSTTSETKTLQLAPYIFFYGRCEEALKFYKDVLGGTYEIMRVKDSPMAEQSPPEMRDKVMRKDDRIRWFISSANRDPNVFAEPGRFDITRQPNPHVAFGNGVHHCLGATLARVEGQEVFKALAERFPDLQIESEELEYQPSITFRSLKSLPVTWQ